MIGDRCKSYMRSIGLTLDDILRDEIKLRKSFKDQNWVIKISAILTMIMLVGGLINSFCCIFTFKDKEIRKLGCGIYLFTSSITSLLTIIVFTLKYWFLILTQTNTTIRLDTFRGGCVIIDPILKIFLYTDTWLNVCVAIERSFSVMKGVKFNQKKSQQVARWIILILPILITLTIIHEPFHRDLFENRIERFRKSNDYEIWPNSSLSNTTQSYDIERQITCITRYSRFMQHYNTAILFFHLLTPFILNVLCALYIIFGSAHRRAKVLVKKKYKEHLRQQYNEHKHLLFSCIVLLILALPRLIIAFVSECVNASDNVWLYLFAYVIPFIPSILIFIIYVPVSDVYKETFKENIKDFKQKLLRFFSS